MIILVANLVLNLYSTVVPVENVSLTGTIPTALGDLENVMTMSFGKENQNHSVVRWNNSYVYVLICLYFFITRMK